MNLHKVAAAMVITSSLGLASLGIGSGAANAPPPSFGSGTHWAQAPYWGPGGGGHGGGGRGGGWRGGGGGWHGGDRGWRGGDWGGGYGGWAPPPPDWGG